MDRSEFIDWLITRKLFVSAGYSTREAQKHANDYAKCGDDIESALVLSGIVCRMPPEEKP
jgi:hypothetical protein